MKSQSKLTAALVAVLLFVACAASAEFTTQEKAEIQKIVDAQSEARWIVFYCMDGLRSAIEPEKPLFVDLCTKSYNLANELRLALNSILTLPVFNADDQEVLNADATLRVARAQTYLDRAFGGYRNIPVRDAIEALLAIGAPLNPYAGNRLNWAEADYASINLECCSFADWKLVDWPFLVRRASDGAGVHGDFEKAKSNEATGRNYINFAMGEVIKTVAAMPYTPQLYLGTRNFSLFWKDNMARLDAVHLISFGMAEGNGADPFARLFAAQEKALPLGGSGLRGMLMFSLGPVVQHMAEHGDGGTGAAAHLAEAVEKTGDGWFFAIDNWSWNATRFPCLEPTAVGCN